LHQLIRYISHLFNARNQHGVHSPFVYDYITKCLYSKKKYDTNTSLNILLKSLAYFSFRKVKTVPENLNIINRIKEEFNSKDSEDLPYDLVYVDFPILLVLASYIDKIHNDSMFLIKNIHRNKQNSTHWEMLKQKEHVKVSIDLFYCGLLFVRKEQAKEDFKIRI